MDWLSVIMGFLKILGYGVLAGGLCLMSSVPRVLASMGLLSFLAGLRGLIQNILPGRKSLYPSSCTGHAKKLFICKWPDFSSAPTPFPPDARASVLILWTGLADPLIWQNSSILCSTRKQWTRMPGVLPAFAGATAFAKNPCGSASGCWTGPLPQALPVPATSPFCRKTLRDSLFRA